MAKARKIPAEIEYFHWQGDVDGFVAWLDSLPKEVDRGSVNFESHDFHIDTLEGPMHISEGDYIICGVANELYPCKAEIFEATYEKVES